MYTLRTRFKKEIVSEFLPPSRKSNKVIILCHGMPSVPSKRELMFFLARKGYWVFFPRYRGSWESGGRFLRKSPDRDIIDIIDELPKGFVSIWDREKFSVQPKSIYLIGGSFGGPAVLLAARDPRVTKAVAISPVVDWRASSRAEPIDWLYGFVKEAFGGGYRVTKKDWGKLKMGNFYNPMREARDMPGRKIFIIHAKDDESVDFKPVKKFAKLTGSKLLLLEKGGHISTSILMKPRFGRAVFNFLRS